MYIFEAAQAIRGESCLQLWQLRVYLLNLSMGGIACSSVHLCRGVVFDLSMGVLAALAMHGVHVALSTEGSAKLYALRRNITNLHAWQKLFNLSIGGVACLPCHGGRHMQPPLQRLLREGYCQGCSKDSLKVIPKAIVRPVQMLFQCNFKG